MCSTSLSSYRPQLSAQELDQALGRLAATARRAEWLLCRYLADIADDKRFRAVGWYSDVLHYARERFGFGVKSTRERVRIGRALRELPRVEEAFVGGRLNYSRVREVTRVATAETEADWLELAQRLSMRELERRVAGQVGARQVCDSPAKATWRTPETIELSMRMPAETWALLKRAMEGARQVSESPMSDAEALEAVARDALTVLAQPDSTDIADPRKAVVLYQCIDCRQTELETNAGAVTLSDKAAERLTAGAKRIELETEGRCEACVGGTMPAAVRRAVLARDRGKCRICGRRRYVDVHHLKPQCEGGEHSRENCACACPSCHGAVHDGELRIEGNADGALTWTDAAGNELGSEEPGRERKGKWISEHTPDVLRTMRGRGGFGMDELCAATGLSYKVVSVAVMELQLAGHIKEGPLGVYSPAHTAGNDASPSAPLAPATRLAPLEAVPTPTVLQTAPSASGTRVELEIGPAEVRDKLVGAMQADGQRRWHPDDLCAATGCSISEVYVALLELQLAGCIREVALGVYQPSRTPSAHAPTISRDGDPNVGRGREAPRLAS